MYEDKDEEKGRRDYWGISYKDEDRKSRQGHRPLEPPTQPPPWRMTRAWQVFVRSWAGQVGYCPPDATSTTTIAASMSPVTRTY